MSFKRWAVLLFHIRKHYYFNVFKASYFEVHSALSLYIPAYTDRDNTVLLLLSEGTICQRVAPKSHAFLKNTDILILSGEKKRRFYVAGRHGLGAGTSVALAVIDLKLLL